LKCEEIHRLKSGPLIADPVDPDLLLESGSALDQIQAAFIAYRLEIGELSYCF
jgi:hypothetical protein